MARKKRPQGGTPKDSGKPAEPAREPSGSGGRSGAAMGAVAAAAAAIGAAADSVTLGGAVLGGEENGRDSLREDPGAGLDPPALPSAPPARRVADASVEDEPQFDVLEPETPGLPREDLPVEEVPVEEPLPGMEPPEGEADGVEEAEAEPEDSVPEPEGIPEEPAWDEPPLPGLDGGTETEPDAPEPEPVPLDDTGGGE